MNIHMYTYIYVTLLLYIKHRPLKCKYCKCGHILTGNGWKVRFRHVSRLHDGAGHVGDTTRLRRGASPYREYTRMCTHTLKQNRQYV